MPIVRSWNKTLFYEVLFRVSLAIITVELENAEPFNRKIHEDELWLYKNPQVESYIPPRMLWSTILIVPITIMFLVLLFQGDKCDFFQAMLSFSLAIGFTSVFTNLIKVTVGRPRPDFFWRCFPDGQGNQEFKCTGDPIVVKDGRKSFPSGHSSLSFSSFGFLALYLAGKLHTFSWNGKTQSWKLSLFMLPLGIALVIAISRTCDYHHHYQDVIFGAALGIFQAYLCYRHYYPPLDSLVCHKPYVALMNHEPQEIKTTRIELNKWER